MSQENRPYIGGQAVLEGVMMRSPASFSVVVRKQSGELVVREQPMERVTSGPSTWPFLRGVLGVVESLRLGQRALKWSAEIMENDQPPETAATSTLSTFSTSLTQLVWSIFSVATQAGDDAPATRAKADAKDAKGGGLMAFAPLVFMIGLFVAAPQLVAEGVTRLLHINLPITSPGYQAITGVAKLVIIATFYSLMRRTTLMYRMFQYHGAEHKAISTYEARHDLVVENARKMTTMHARCGTTFVVMVALVSILTFSALGFVLPHPEGAGRLVTSIGFFFAKLPCLPLIMSITFEIQRIFARYCTTGPLRMLLWPGFLVQKITTAEPDDEQLEVALASLKAALWREEAQSAPVVGDRTFPDYKTLLADPGYAS
jgi:uncharacterized protein YqhQ